jgi:hypothetical protein
MCGTCFAVKLFLLLIINVQVISICFLEYDITSEVFLKHPSPLLDHLGVLIGFPEEVGFGELRKL